MFHNDWKHNDVDRLACEQPYCMPAARPILQLQLTLVQGNWEYTVSKYGLRGLMRTARRSTGQQGIRINYVAPCYVKSAIRSASYEKYLTDKGVEFAFPEDVATSMMKIASDPTINGKLPICCFSAHLLWRVIVLRYMLMQERQAIRS